MFIRAIHYHLHYLSQCLNYWQYIFETIAKLKVFRWTGMRLNLVAIADDMTSFVRDTPSHCGIFDTINLFGVYSGLLGSKVIKILGITFTKNYSLFYKLNFESIEKSLIGLLKCWDWGGLTLLGKIQVIKSFAIPKILYNTLLYSFVWKGKDKVKRTTLINPIDKGLKMPNIESMISAQSIIRIKRYIAHEPATWKFFLDFYLLVSIPAILAFQ